MLMVLNTMEINGFCVAAERNVISIKMMLIRLRYVHRLGQ